MSRIIFAFLSIALLPATIVAQPDDAPIESPRKFLNYAADAPPIEKWMHGVLDMPVSKLDFPGDTPLSDILDGIEQYYTTTYGDTPEGKFQFTFFPDHGELGLEQIDSLDDITVTDVQLDGISLRNALTLIFAQTEDDRHAPVPLTYVIQNEVVLITTKDKAESAEMLCTRVHDVAKLLAVIAEARETQPSAKPETTATSLNHGPGGLRKAVETQTEEGLYSIQFSAGGMGCATGASSELSQEQNELITILVDHTINADGDNWSSTVGGNGTTGTVTLFGEKLVVRQVQNTQEDIVRLLNLLSD